MSFASGSGGTTGTGATAAETGVIGPACPGSQRQFLFMGLAVLATIGLVVFFHLQATTDLEKAQHDNTILQADVAKRKQELGDYDKIRGQREELLKQRKTIQSLEAGRTGPVYLLRELSEILSPGKGPTFDRVTYEEALRKDAHRFVNRQPSQSSA